MKSAADIAANAIARATIKAAAHISDEDVHAIVQAAVLGERERCAKLVPTNWRGRVLTGRYSHWCYEWDGLPVDETTPEWPCGCATTINMMRRYGQSALKE